VAAAFMLFAKNCLLAIITTDLNPSLTLFLFSSHQAMRKRCPAA
jgi:hypothetical protein